MFEAQKPRRAPRETRFGVVRVRGWDKDRSPSVHLSAIRSVAFLVFLTLARLEWAGGSCFVVTRAHTMFLGYSLHESQDNSKKTVASRGDFRRS